MSAEESIEDIDFQKYWEIIKRRWQIGAAVFGATLVLAILYALTRSPMYKAEAMLLFKTNRTSSLTGLGEDLGRLETLNIDNSPLDTQAQIVRSIPILQETIKVLTLEDSRGNPLKPTVLAKNLEAKGVAGTDVLSISYTADNPESAAEVVNTIVDIYIKNNLQTNRAEASSAREFISEQLPKTEQAVRQADSNLRQFKEQNGVIILEDEAKAAVQIILITEEQIAQAKAQLSDVTAKLTDLQNKVGLDSRQAVVFASLSQSPAVQEIVTQLQQAQTQLTIDQTRYVAEHPTIANQNRKIEALNTLLQERITTIIGNEQMLSSELQAGPLKQDLITNLVNIEIERQGLIQRINTLLNSQAAYRQRAGVLPRLEQTQRELERRSQVAQTTYENLLLRLQQIQVAENQNIGNARIISPALVPESSVGSSKKLILIGGLFAGSMLAIIAIFVLDLIDSSIKSVKDAKEHLGYTLLGVIPNLHELSRSSLQHEISDQLIPKVIVKENPRSPISEAYQMLQANLKFLDSDKAIKSVIITSSKAREGKSEVSANLAAAIAQVGRSVLLVDTDLRHPIQHHIWNLNNTKGLTHMLVEHAALKDCVCESMPNLHVLTAGVVPPNPVPLLDSSRMATLIKNFSEQYDFVILDAPALVGVADASVLGKLVDGILLVAQLGLVTSSDSEISKELLDRSNQRVLGMVLTGVDMKSGPNSYIDHHQEYIDELDRLQQPLSNRRIS